MSKWERPEISDLILQYEPDTGHRIPVLQQDALEQCRSSYARSVIRSIPLQDGHLCPEAVDQLLVTAHGELQRLWEEFFHGPRVAKVLTALVGSLRGIGVERSLRVVDIGCGSGYLLRWLSAHGVLEGDVSWVGVDFNRALIEQARALAETEQLSVTFKVANAFKLEEPVDIFVSSGVMHHFRGAALERFFEAQAACEPLAFAHFDPQSSWATPLGSFLFHFSRMRTPLARYDGWLSAARAHSGVVLEQAARSGCAELSLLRYHPPISWFPLARTLTGIIGVKASAAELFYLQLDEPLRKVER